jgi:hypothetical protein
MRSQDMTNTRRQLQKECSTALQHYIQILSDGCDLLGEVKEGLITENKREQILSHRKQQLLAHDAYEKAQRRLWRLLSDSDPRLDNLTDTPQPKRNSRERSSREPQKDDRRTG